ncbi:MAG: ATP-binding protein [Lachnospiraceae bacterium]|nr:ATP-binding protein [Lachnospiraceae bacterium]
MKDITVDATLDNLEVVQNFVSEELENQGCSMKVMMQIEIAVEEIYVNIVHYAYNPEIGKATIRCEVTDDPMQVIIQFLDSGVPFDPLAKEDADITLSAEDRQIGGLGIFMVKKSMDEVSYEYKEGKNVLTIRKVL